MPAPISTPITRISRSRHAPRCCIRSRCRRRAAIRCSRTSMRLMTIYPSRKRNNWKTWLRHPIVRRHPVTGRKALYSVSGSSFRVGGMPDDEAVDLLDELKRHATQQKYQLRLKYGVGDIVIWDNASLLHSATLTDPADPRTLWRITVKEEGRT